MNRPGGVLLNSFNSSDTNKIESILLLSVIFNRFGELHLGNIQNVVNLTWYNLHMTLLLLNGTMFNIRINDIIYKYIYNKR